jgi:zinc-ribbon domain
VAAPTARFPDHNEDVLFEILIIGAPFAWFATAYVGWKKGSSFWLWFLIGAVLPYFGLIGALLYRHEDEEPERTCPRCGKVLKLYVQVCPKCGLDLYLPEADEADEAAATAARP